MRKRLQKARIKLMGMTEKSHGSFHLLFGIISYAIGYKLQPAFFAENPLTLLSIALLGSFIPDIDHFFYYYGYGRKKDYSVICREFIKKRDFKGFFSFVKANHKNNTGIYSHNFGSVFLAGFFTFYALYRRENIYMSMFFLAWTFHYVFDIFEDILFFKKPNKNWFFRFNKD